MTRPERIRRATQLLLAAVVLAAVGCDGGPTVVRNTSGRDTAMPDPNEDAALSMLLLESGEPNTVAPTDGNGAVPQEADLPRAGTLVIDQPATLVKDARSDWYRLEFDNAEALDGHPRRRVLPSRLLEKMEQLRKLRPDAEFRVSGETTLYDGHAYILLRRAASYKTGQKSAENPSGEAKPDTDTPSDPNATTQPASPEDIMAELLKHKPDRPVRLPNVDSNALKDDSVAPRPIKGSGRPKTIVQNRVVYFVPEKDSDWWEARFVSDNTLTDRPARLLPNRLRERAEDLAKTTADRGRLFTVSGEITHYKGRRYLLIRKLFVKRDMGQF
ncbi:MAG: hypothetical protein ACOCWV_04025 [Planctomycetota bacterium]